MSVCRALTFALVGLCMAAGWSAPALAQCTNCTETTVGDDRVLIFRSGTGSFTAPPGLSSVRYLVVAGGGGGGGVTASGDPGVGGAGGGGAGGLRAGTLAVGEQTYTVTVGAGGAPGIGGTAAGGNGGSSSFAGIVATGGGGGGSVGALAGRAGGSGGGGRLDASGGAGTGGQGNAGGAGAGGTVATGAAGGGGGAGSAGAAGNNNTGGAGGAGVTNNITGSNVVYAGGGGGGGFFLSSPGGVGGSGGAGGGGNAPPARGPGLSGAPNTGGGGGGASGARTTPSAYNGGAGGSGIVIVRYTPPPGIFYTRASGNWSNPATWSGTGCGGATAGATPHSASNVVICDSHAVSLDISTTIRGLTVLTGNSASSLTHNGTNALNIGSGGVELNGGDGGAPQVKAWNINDGSAVVNGNVTLNGGNGNRLAQLQLTSGTLDINGNLTFGSNPSNALLSMTGPATVTLSGAMSVTSGGGRLEPGTQSAFVFDGAGDQTALLGVSDINYHNLTFAGGGTKGQTTWNTPTITGDTTVNAGVTFNNSASVNYQGRFVNNGTTQASAEQQYLSAFINNGSYSATSAQNYRGDFTNAGSFNSGSGEHRFNGSVPQLVTGETTFSVLAFDNPTNVTLADDILVLDRMAFTNGQVITDENVLRIRQDGYSGITRSNGWVAGNLGMWIPTGFQNRTFDIGDATDYRPVTVDFPGQTSSAGYLVISVSQSPGDHPQIASANLDPGLSVNRWWTLEPEGLAANDYSVNFNYLAGDRDAGADPQSFAIQRLEGGVWNPVAVGNRSATATQGVNINGFGQFAIAEPGAASGQCPDGFAAQPGLLGEYSNWTGGSPPAFPMGGDATRVDGPIDFNWTGGSPGVTGINANQFAVRWAGLIRVENSGSYQFQTVSDDGVRLDFNGTTLIQNWSDHSAQTNTSGTVNLVAGETYPITLYYYENSGQAVVRLRGGFGGNFNPIPSGPEPTPGYGLYHCVQVPDPDTRRYYPFDEASWFGDTGEVQDESGNDLDGTAQGDATTQGIDPAVAGNPGTCRYGQFDGVNDYVEAPGLSNDLNATASLTFWIRTTQTGNDSAWQAPGVTGVEENGGTDDIFWGWLDSQGRIGLSVGNDFDNWKSNTAVNTGEWQHVALTRDHQSGAFKIYVNGVLENSGAIATGVIGNPFSSIGLVENTGAAEGNFFEGNLDEIRVYDFVLSDEQVSAIKDDTHPCEIYVAGYRIDHIGTAEPPGTGVTCEAEPITVTAIDDAGNAVVPPSGTGVDLSANTGGTWPNGNSYIYQGTESEFQLLYFQPTPAEVIFEATDGVASGVSEPLIFRDTAIRIYGSATQLTIPTQIAGVEDSNPFLRVIKTNEETGACDARVQGVQEVRMGYECLNPGTCISGERFTVNGSDIAALNGGNSATPLSLNFSAASEASIPIKYTDVGQLRLYAQITLEATAEEEALTLDTYSNPFVVKPYRLEIQNISDAAGNGNPGTQGSGAGFVAAGETFRAQVASLNADGVATPNFGNESTPERISLEYALEYPAGGRIGTLGGVNGSTVTAGVANFESLVWDEVGALNLTPYLEGRDYLDAGDVSEPTDPTLVGRFYPAAYELVSHEVIPSCSGFSYMSQPTMEVRYQLEARNLGGGVTANYDNDNLDYSGTATTGYLAENDNSGDSGEWDARLGTLEDGETWTAGVLAFEDTQASITRASEPDGPYAQLQLSMALTNDLDNRPLQPLNTAPASADTDCTTDDSCTAANLGQPFELRFGRLRLESAFGPEVLDLRAPLYTEYWDGERFVRNADDSCTRLSRTAITYEPTGSLADDSNRTVPIGGGSTTGQYDELDNVAVQFENSRADQIFTAPGEGNTGSFNIQIDLTNYPWLRFDWNQDGDYLNDVQMPPASVGFGSYRGHDRIIYWREVLE